jgi:hypothetical protein
MITVRYAGLRQDQTIASSKQGTLHYGLCPWGLEPPPCPRRDLRTNHPPRARRRDVMAGPGHGLSLVSRSSLRSMPRAEVVTRRVGELVSERSMEPSGAVADGCLRGLGDSNLRPSDSQKPTTTRSAGGICAPACVDGAGTHPHRRLGAWTCKVLSLVVFIRMPVVDPRPQLPPGSAPSPQVFPSVCRVVEECVR